MRNGIKNSEHDEQPIVGHKNSLVLWIRDGRHCQAFLNQRRKERSEKEEEILRSYDIDYSPHFSKRNRQGIR